jgi:hypothetical protein
MIFDLLNALMGIFLFFLKFVVVILFFLWLMLRDKIKAAGGIGPYLEQVKVQQAQFARERPPTINQTMRLGTALAGSVIFFVLGSAVLAGGIYFQWQVSTRSWRLQSEGVKTWATVLEKRVDEDSDGDDTYYLRYRWTLADGKGTRREVESQVSDPVYQAVEAGQPIEVIYVPGSPEIVKVTADYHPEQQNFWPIGVGLGVGLVFFLLMGLDLDAYLKGLRLQAQGQEILVPLLECYIISDEGTSYHVVYELPGVGKVCTSVSKKDYERVTVGTTVALRYLPENPRIFWLDC